eukprot:m.113866 g.113866  ORF g.113866 m.113866 type:complete len:446 (+) comp37467_c0_seq2:320-1657(+)
MRLWYRISMINRTICTSFNSQMICFSAVEWLSRLFSTRQLEIANFNFIQRKFLSSECHSWLTEVTGIQLTEQISATFSKYNHLDTLLCHDDELEGRCIAFILYLVPDWCDEDGGLLGLFNTTDGHPDRIVQSLIPQWNTFVFFEVSPVSFHQVSEVLSESKTRLSISGWFHGFPPERLPLCPTPAPALEKPLKMSVDGLFEWVNSRYFDPEIQATIRDKFEEDSSIELHSFLLEDKYSELMSELAGVKNSDWEVKGPANLKHVFELSPACETQTVAGLMALFKSEPFFYLLTQLTGLELSNGSCVADVAEEASAIVSSLVSPCCCGVWRQWNHGCYTLIRDTDAARGGFSLDASLCFVGHGKSQSGSTTCLAIGLAVEWKADFGGYTSFIAKGEDEELLTVLPTSNALALVYRDEETLKFTKYVNALSSCNDCKEFYDLYFTYYE